MDEHKDEGMDEGMEDFGPWSAGVDQVAATARDAAPVLAACYRGLRAQGLDQLEASLLASMHVWTLGIQMPGEEE